MSFEVYKDEGNKYRWRHRNDRNGQIQAASGESFDSKHNAERAVWDFLDELAPLATLLHPEVEEIKDD